MHKIKRKQFYKILSCSRDNCYEPTDTPNDILEFLFLNINKYKHQQSSFYGR